MSSFDRFSIPTAPHIELHDKLNLTGCEVSVNILPPNKFVPIVHSHKKNEELYIVLEGSGEFYVDGEVLPVKAGDCFRFDPPVKRSFKAGPEGLKGICIQTKAGSLEGYTATDGVVESDKAPWHQS